MAQLTPAFFKTILAIEGGYQNRADDAGNYACGTPGVKYSGNQVGTKYGISAGAYQTWTGRCPTVSDMQAITTDQAFQFYAWYFDRYNLFKIDNQQFFELLANNTMGSPAGAARAEQRALNTLGYKVTIDGARGPETIAALNAAWRKKPAAIYNAVRQEWITYLNSINKPQFLPGWINRLNKYFPPMAAAAAGGLGLAAVITLGIIFLTSEK